MPNDASACSICDGGHIMSKCLSNKTPFLWFDFTICLSILYTILVMRISSLKEAWRSCNIWLKIWKTKKVRENPAFHFVLIKFLAHHHTTTRYSTYRWSPQQLLM